MFGKLRATFILHVSRSCGSLLLSTATRYSYNRDSLVLVTLEQQPFQGQKKNQISDYSVCSTRF